MDTAYVENRKDVQGSEASRFFLGKPLRSVGSLERRPARLLGRGTVLKKALSVPPLGGLGAFSYGG
jgi:hypothetical protein